MDLILDLFLVRNVVSFVVLQLFLCEVPVLIGVTVFAAPVLLPLS